MWQRRERGGGAAHLNSIKASFLVVQAAEKQRSKENKNPKKRKPKNKLFKKNMFYINFCWASEQGRNEERTASERSRRRRSSGNNNKQRSAGRKINKESARTNGMQLER